MSPSDRNARTGPDLDDGEVSGTCPPPAPPASGRGDHGAPSPAAGASSLSVPRRNSITPERQRAFIAALAAGGIVTQAARAGA